jgi:hypothetical protein
MICWWMSTAFGKLVRTTCGSNCRRPGAVEAAPYTDDARVPFERAEERDVAVEKGRERPAMQEV